MARPKRPKKLRVNLEMSPAQKARLENCRVLGDCDSFVETVRRALVLYEHVLENRVVLVSVGDDGVERKVLVI